MIIRSQDGKELHNLDRISNIRVFELSNGEAIVEVNWQHSIGRYSTEEKAVKVLDMIQNKYFEHMTLEQNGTITGILEKPKVFLMPQDSEVLL